MISDRPVQHVTTNTARAETPSVRRLLMIGLLSASAISVSTSAFAIEKPPLAADNAPPTVAPSTISATVQFSLSALDRALERKVPRRLATIDDEGRSCWHRRILGRMVNIDCEYSGYVERTGPISLRSEDGRLNAAMPLFGTVSGQGIGRFARLLHGTGEGQLMVYATARPRLRPDWSVSLDMSEGFRCRNRQPCKSSAFVSTSLATLNRGFGSRCRGFSATRQRALPR